MGDGSIMEVVYLPCYAMKDCFIGCFPLLSHHLSIFRRPASIIVARLSCSYKLCCLQSQVLNVLRGYAAGKMEVLGGGKRTWERGAARRPFRGLAAGLGSGFAASLATIPFALRVATMLNGYLSKMLRQV